MEAKYDKIGINYNRTRKADDYLAKRLVAHLRPKKEGIYLDIGCGTGNYTNELQKRGFDFIGIDPSREMLEKAKTKNHKIEWKIGTAEKTGLPENSVDGIIGFLTIHHWTHLNNAFHELSKVLRPKGNIVIFTSTPQQMQGYWLNHYFPKLMAASMKQMPTSQKLIKAMEQAGIGNIQTEQYSVKPTLKDLFLYCGKQNPNRYFDENIRHGISSFSSLANQEEVTQGLAQLRKDIDSGKIKEVIKSYENDLGDYLFVVGKNSHIQVI